MAIKLIVKAGEHSREHCPVSARVSLGDLDPGRLVLVSECCGRRFPCQVEAGSGSHTVTWILDALAAGSEKAFVLQEGEPQTAGGVAFTRDTAGQIGVFLDGSHFSTFHYGAEWARPFLHPLVGPHGEPLTRAFPIIPDVPGEKQDHPHHKSFWVAWGEVNGTDNWSENQERGHAVIRVTDLHESVPGPVSGRIASHNDWLSEKGVKVLSEDRTMVFYATPADLRAVDLTVTFRATEGPVRFGDTKEGGICSIRVASSMDASGAGTIVNAYGGTNEAETWGKRAQWCDYYGPVRGNTVGIAILDHPANYGYPTYWHVRNYGLMTANPFGLSHFLGDRTMDGSYRLEAGGALTFRYRVLLHAGSTGEAGIGERYHDFINPPAVRVEA